MSLNAANYNLGKLLEADVLINQGLVENDSAQFNQAEQKNNIVSAESIEQNQKEVNELFIRYAKNNYHFNHADKLRLKQLAALCPETEGTSIYQARTLVSKFDNTNYYNECELNDPTNMIANSNKTIKTEANISSVNKAIYVYPNPGNGELFIEIQTVQSNDNVRVELIDNLGNIINSIEYKEMAVYKCDISNIPSGIYYYKIYLNSLITKTDKLVIIK